MGEKLGRTFDIAGTSSRYLSGVMGGLSEIPTKAQSTRVKRKRFKKFLTKSKVSFFGPKISLNECSKVSDHLENLNRRGWPEYEKILENVVKCL